jgi:probable F420-dependent oxidoreductase
VAAEYEGLGIPMERPGLRIERLAETVEVLRAHWAGQPMDIKGTFVRASGFAGRPRPVQQPYPPIFIGGGAPRVLKLAGRLADIVSINFNNAAGKLGAASVASSTRQATAEKIGWIREGAGDRFGDIELEIAAYFVAISDDPADAVAAMARRFRVPAEVLAEHPHALIGSLPEICDKLEQRRGELGVSYINIAQRSMEAFAPVVAPAGGPVTAPPADGPR